LTPGENLRRCGSLVNPFPLSGQHGTLKDSSMFVWDRATLRNLAIRFPRVVENAMLIGYDYLGWYVAAHVALVSHTARERLAGVLTCLAQGIGEKVAGGFEFEATNEELAGAANVTAFTASRFVERLAK